MKRSGINKANKQTIQYSKKAHLMHDSDQMNYMSKYNHKQVTIMENRRNSFAKFYKVTKI